MVLSADPPLRILVIGTGSIGRRHVRSIQRLEPDAVFALLRDGAREDDYSRSLNAPVFANVGEALDWAPNLAIIANPSNRHSEVLEPLLDHGVATFVEKPLVIDEASAERLFRRDPEALPPTQVGCVLRFLPAVETARRWVGQGRCGRLARAQFTVGQYLPDWRPQQDYRVSYSADRARGGGVIFDLVHEFDLAVALLGQVSLHCCLAATRSTLELACEDTAVACGRTAEGVLVGFSLDYVSRQRTRFFEIVGDEGTIVCDLAGAWIEFRGVNGYCERETGGFDYDMAFTAEFAELIAALRSGGPTRLPIHEGLKATMLALQAHRLAVAEAERTSP